MRRRRISAAERSRLRRSELSPPTSLWPRWLAVSVAIALLAGCSAAGTEPASPRSMSSPTSSTSAVDAAEATSTTATEAPAAPIAADEFAAIGNEEDSGDDPLPRDARPPAPRDRTPPSARGAASVNRIEIPKIGLSHQTFEGIDMPTINRGPSHWPGTANPGERGNAVFPGHRTTYTRPFWDIDKLAPGDEVIFTTPAGRFTYRVTETFVVGARDSWITDPTDEATFTIFACHPKGSARQRYVVKGTLTSPPAAPPPTTTTSPPSSPTTTTTTTTTAPPQQPLLPGLGG